MLLGPYLLRPVALLILIPSVITQRPPHLGASATDLVTEAFF